MHNTFQNPRIERQRGREIEKMGRKANCDNQYAMNRGPWSAEEDKILMNYVQVHGEGKWRELSKRAGIYVIFKIILFPNFTSFCFWCSKCRLEKMWEEL